MFGLADYFEKPSSESLDKSYYKGTYGNYLKNPSTTESENLKIALIGVTETRNSILGEYNSDVDLVRSFFYKLAYISKIPVIDLGNLKKGIQVKDTYAAIEYVTDTLLKNNVLPIYFGGSQDITISILKSLHKINNECNLTIIDSKIDMFDHEFHSESYINEINNSKTTLSVLGHQMYFNSEETLKTAETNYWNLIRLGLIRKDYSQVEPLLRDTDFLSFDMSSVRQSDCPSASFSSPNGLYAEEACQLSNLAGVSDQVKVFYLSEFNANKDQKEQSAHLCAQILWHFILGISKRKNDFPVKELANYKKIYVKLDKIDMDLVFYENSENKRFWVEIPMKGATSKVISCSENDYRNICNNEIPDRIWRNISRYL